MQSFWKMARRAALALAILLGAAGSMPALTAPGRKAGAGQEDRVLGGTEGARHSRPA